MKLRSLLITSVLGLTVLGIIFSAHASAWTQFRSSKDGTVPSGETVDSSLWVAANSIDIAGVVNGDLFCAGQMVNISGTVKGDVICGAQTINISGSVDGDVRAAAQTINISGEIGKNATLAGQTINVDSAAKIGGDASLAGQELNVNGKVGRDLAVGGKNVNVNGKVGRDITSSANNISLGKTAKVGGGISYTSDNQISINQEASVSGKVTHNYPKQGNKQWVHIGFFGNIIALVAAWLLLISALILTALFPQLIHRVSNQGVVRPWWALLTGFTASIIVPILIILLLITVVGIPLAILLLLVWALIAATSGLFSVYYVGRIVWRAQHNPILIVLAGGLIVLILLMVPYLGFLVMLGAFWLGSGMAILHLKDNAKRPKYHVS